jgi:hypothetical protein
LKSNRNAILGEALIGIQGAGFLQALSSVLADPYPGHRPRGHGRRLFS